ncbi:MAG: hypothetical protein A2X28_00970 [Elusimicrobia bacterium GWA2_56_46]|nr:MAG: hypothetical protein A2X28_00970 [Elusimicrobia bacterium GWA2_56_46]OGR55934.1 MAG: hypothetical protein A2X39_06335 [Elusimicrobia bacterium GWC2_56_31]HBB67493.1 hypothetical protein [Elusimicrobiota bacterium]HBW22128.1 hypothetical protein [Elusimicrobiota bacterium]
MKNKESVDIKKSGRDAFARVGGALRRPFSYLETFISDAGVAAIHPSSKYLVARVVRAVLECGPCAIVEFGAAEGNMTKKILKGLPQNGTLAAIERNADFYKSLVEIRDARLRTACGDVRDMKNILGAMGVGKADCFVSGIPFSFLSPAERSALIHEVYCRLPRGGRFVAYQCTTHLIPLLRRQFQQLKVELELRNMPPHFVFTAVKK